MKDFWIGVLVGGIGGGLCIGYLVYRYYYALSGLDKAEDAVKKML